MDVEEYKYVRDKVSIVTPVFNGETYLAAFLNSVLNQNYQLIEMILVDDGSTDGTVLVAESFRGQFAAKGYEYHIIQARHKNASAAINRGLSCVTGEFLIWPDSDDVLERDSVKRRVDFLRDRPQYHCVRTLAYYRDAETGKIRKADEKAGDLSKEDLFWDILEAKTYVCCGCYMVRTKSFFEIYTERSIPEYDVGQNFQMLLPFMYYHRCPTIREKLYGVSCRKDSHSRRKLTQSEEEQKYRDYEKLVDEIADICKLDDDESRGRIESWKVWRRYQIAFKYGNYKRAVSALKQLYKYRKINLFQIIKSMVWIFVKKIKNG